MRLFLLLLGYVTVLYHTRILIWYNHIMSMRIYGINTRILIMYVKNNHTRMVRIIVPYAYGAYEATGVYTVVIVHCKAIASYIGTTVF